MSNYEQPNYEKIMQDARRLRAETMRQLMSGLVARLFRRGAMSSTGRA